MYVNLEIVTIPVSDVDKALEFYHERLGWRLDADIKNGDVRVVQITPTGAGHTSIAFGQGIPMATPGFFPAARIPGPDPERASYNSYASFEDPDGNGWTLQEVTTRLPGRAPQE